MKRIISLTLVLAALLLTATPVHAALPPTVDPQYTDARTVITTLSISDSGLATLVLQVAGNQTLTNTSVKIHQRQGTVLCLDEVNDMWYVIKG